ncbi:carbohydrate kinase, partial [Pseudomonas oryzihabitans]
MHDELPFQLYSAQQVRDLDAQLIAGGLPGLELMRRAAAAAWRSLRHGWPHAGSLCVLAGAGNNAGDGYLVASLARKAGWQARVWHLADPAGLKGDAALAHAEALAAGVDIQPWHADAPLEGVVVDALLGTGLKGAAREPYAAAIQRINASELPVVAIDLPSGLDADTGTAAGPLVRADLTITFIGLKLGLFTGKGPDHVGSLVFEPLMEEPQNPAHATAQRLAPGNLPRLAPRP